MTASNVTIDELTTDPHAALAAARATAPVSRLPALDAWIVTTRAAAVDVMRDPERFTVDDPRFTTGQILGPSMLSTDGAVHDAHRAPFAPWFADRDELDRLSRWMNDRARSIVGSVAADGRAELRSAIAAPLAAATVAHALGLDPPGADQLLGWYRTIAAGVQRLTAGVDSGDAPAAYRSLAASIDHAVAAGPPAALAAAAATLPPPAIAANTAVILFGGIETSEGATANALWHLLTVDGLFSRVRADRTLVPPLVEESLRLEPAAASVDRYARVDVELHGASIAAGDYVIVSLAAANRDPDIFADPDRFVLDRRNVRSHTTFALGPHACLGIHLARAQTIAAVDAVLDALPDLRLRPDSTGPRGLVFRKAESLNATWSPR